MKGNLNHVNINVSDFGKSLSFYKDLLGYLDYKIVVEGDDYAGFSDGTTSIWIHGMEEKYKTNKFHRKNIGINHLAFQVPSKEDVDRFSKEFLNQRKLNVLYNTPKLFPEYSKNYYAVFFEDPDRIKLEIVHNS